MKGIAKYRRCTISISFIVLCVTLLTECINDEEQDKVVIKNAEWEQFAGSAECAGCHKSIYENHVKTAHFHTSEIVSEKNILGSFDSGKNTFIYSTGGMVKMEKRAGHFYQVAYTRGVERISQRFDIITGSGTKGQSYLTWSGTNLFQLPVTYLTSVNQWCNSPGNPNKIALNRVITSRCLECHTTFVETISAQYKEPEDFDRSHMILGVDCEKCHGPSARHVEFQTHNPKETKGAFIINPARFNRQQSLDICALCHGGRLQKIKPSFEFKAGEKLADYFLIDTAPKDAGTIDVHGNQFGLLAASKCFLKSNTLTCNTCHNPHENEKGKVGLFSQRCLNCHNDKQTDAVLCKMTGTLGSEINKNCIDCHMPEQPSKAIAVLLQGDSIPTSALMHTHLIKNYPDETKKVIAFIKKKSTG
ncbi:MAG: multiheme c-type cytochrome [Ferruginibacter sp.]